MFDASALTVEGSVAAMQTQLALNQNEAFTFLITADPLAIWRKPIGSQKPSLPSKQEALRDHLTFQAAVVG